MRRIGTCLLAFLSAPASAATEQPATMALGDVTAAEALELADRLLPAEIAASVVEGRIGREWLPGQAFVALFHEAPRDRGDRLCSMMVHAVPLRNLRAPADPPADLRLTIEPVQSNATIAVRPEWEERPCTANMPYVAIAEGLGGAWQQAAYRRLLDWMALAREGHDPGIALSCRSEEADACADPLRALATLPLETLRGIQVQNPRRLVPSADGGTRVLIAAPLTEEGPREATVSLGPSGADGRSWILSWTENDGAAPTLRMSRTSVFYH